MTDDAFVEAINALHSKIDTGFGGVYDRIDRVSDGLESNLRQLDMEFSACKANRDQFRERTMDIINRIGGRMDNHITANGVEKEGRMSARQFWQNVCVAVISVAVTGALIFLYQLVIHHPLKG